LICVSALVLLLYGCVTTRYETGRIVDASKVTRIEKGETTSAEILEWFGVPTTVSAIAEHQLYVYKHCKTKGAHYSLGYYASGSTKQQCDELSVTFDRSTGRVVAYSFQRGLPQ
jgi:hypothetical protein